MANGWEAHRGDETPHQELVNNVIIRLVDTLTTEVSVEEGGEEISKERDGNEASREGVGSDEPDITIPLRLLKDGKAFHDVVNVGLAQRPN